MCWWPGELGDLGGICEEGVVFHLSGVCRKDSGRFSLEFLTGGGESAQEGREFGVQRGGEGAKVQETLVVGLVGHHWTVERRTLAG